MADIKESDWKLFKEIKAQAVEAFCEERLQEYREIIEGESRSAHERYLHLFQLAIRRDKQMAVLFDGHSRSRAHIQLLAIRREGLASEGLVSKLTDEFRDATDPARFE